jgi:hypothetical protein
MLSVKDAALAGQLLKSSPTISLRGYRAHRALRSYRLLPQVLRTPARTGPVLAAILLYAYEGCDAEADALSWAQSRQVCSRLQEFLPDAVPAGHRGLMDWLHENLVPEAMQHQNDLAELLGDCLRSG